MMMANGLLTTKSMIEECSGQEGGEVRTFVKDVFKISKIMAFAAKDNCPENQWNDWSYWNEEKKKWKFEKSSLMTRCNPPPSSEEGNASAELTREAGNNASDSTVEKGRRVTISISTSTCLLSVLYSIDIWS